MKILLTSLLLLGLISCSNHSLKRDISSNYKDISGTFLGAAAYTKVQMQRGQKRSYISKRTAVRVYFRELENEKGSYNAIVLEYAKVGQIAPRFLMAKLFKKAPFIKNLFGNLKTIANKIYKGY